MKPVGLTITASTTAKSDDRASATEIAASLATRRSVVASPGITHDPNRERHRKREEKERVRLILRSDRKDREDERPTAVAAAPFGRSHA